MANAFRLFIIVWGVALVRTEVLTDKMQHEMVFRSLLASQKPAEVIHELSRDFMAAMGVDAVSSGSLTQALMNALTINVPRLVILRTQLNMDDLSNDLFEFLRFFTPMDVLLDHHGFRMNLQDFLNDVMRTDLQRSNWTPTEYDKFISDDMLAKVIARVETDGRWQKLYPLDYEAAKTELTRLVRKSMAFKVGFLNSYKRLRTDPVAVVTKFTREFVAVLASDLGRTFTNFEEVIRPLIAILSSFGGEKALENIGKVFEDSFWNFPFINVDIFRKVGLVVVRSMAARTGPSASEKDWDILFRARDLFQGFYLSSVFPPLSPNYLSFLRAYYRANSASIADTLGLKNPRFDQRALFIDLLFSVGSRPDSLVSAADLKLVLQKIEVLASNFSQEDLETLSYSRALFQVSDAYLSRHFELFADLYEARLQVVAHWKYREHEDSVSIWAKWATYLDEAVAALTSKPKLAERLFAPKLNDEFMRFYGASVRNLYFFFKTTLLLAKSASEETAVFTFAEFECRDDWLVHAFTLEPSVRRFLKPLQSLVRPKAGYNYCVFSEMTIDGLLLKKLAAAEKGRREFIARHGLADDD